VQKGPWQCTRIELVLCSWGTCNSTWEVSLSIRKLTGKHECYIRVSATVMGEKKQGYDIDKVEGAIRWVNFPL
jgi:hypothetical protein